MSENIYKLFFRIVVGAFAIYGVANASTQFRLAEKVRPTWPSIESEDDVGTVEVPTRSNTYKHR